MPPKRPLEPLKIHVYTDDQGHLHCAHCRAGIDPQQIGQLWRNLITGDWLPICDVCTSALAMIILEAVADPPLQYAIAVI